MDRKLNLDRAETFSFVNPWIRYFLFFFSFLFWVSKTKAVLFSCTSAEPSWGPNAWLNWPDSGPPLAVANGAYVTYNIICFEFQ